jgi:hypothetical protein
LKITVPRTALVRLERKSEKITYVFREPHERSRGTIN